MKRPVFKPEFYRELALENPLGLSLHWREAEAWFNFIAWPRYKTYRYTRHTVAVRRWWASVSTRDIQRAREAMANVEIERAQAEQATLLDDEVLNDDTPYDDTLRRIFGGECARP